MTRASWTITLGHTPNLRTSAPTPPARRSPLLRLCRPSVPKQRLPRAGRRKNRHTREHRSGATTPPETTDLDQFASTRSYEGTLDLPRGGFRVFGYAKVSPLDQIRGPG